MQGRMHLCQQPCICQQWPQMHGQPAGAHQPAGRQKQAFCGHVHNMGEGSCQGNAADVDFYLRGVGGREHLTDSAHICNGGAAIQLEHAE